MKNNPSVSVRRNWLVAFICTYLGGGGLKLFTGRSYIRLRRLFYRSRDHSSANVLNNYKARSSRVINVKSKTAEITYIK